MWACEGMAVYPNGPQIYEAALKEVLMEKGGLSEERAENRSRMFAATMRSDAK